MILSSMVLLKICHFFVSALGIFSEKELATRCTGGIQRVINQREDTVDMPVLLSPVSDPHHDLHPSSVS